VKLDKLFVTAQTTLKVGTPDCDKLIALHRSGEKVEGFVDQFPWMPFVVDSMIEEGQAVTFNLKMKAR
jgi:hypothetical protein